MRRWSTLERPSCQGTLWLHLFVFVYYFSSSAFPLVFFLTCAWNQQEKKIIFVFMNWTRMVLKLCFYLAVDKECWRNFNSAWLKKKNGKKRSFIKMATCKWNDTSLLQQLKVSFPFALCICPRQWQKCRRCISFEVNYRLLVGQLLQVDHNVWSMSLVIVCKASFLDLRMICMLYKHYYLGFSLCVHVA